MLWQFELCGVCSTVDVNWNYIPALWFSNIIDRKKSFSYSVTLYKQHNIEDKIFHNNMLSLNLVAFETTAHFKGHISVYSNRNCKRAQLRSACFALNMFAGWKWVVSVRAHRRLGWISKHFPHTAHTAPNPKRVQHYTATVINVFTLASSARCSL